MCRQMFIAVAPNLSGLLVMKKWFTKVSSFHYKLPIPYLISNTDVQ